MPPSASELGVRHASLVKWLEILRDYESSGLSLKGFAKQQQQRALDPLT